MCEDNPQELQALNRLKSLAYQNGYVNERDKKFLQDTKDTNAPNLSYKIVCRVFDDTF